jgi:hypothetical protein
MLTIEQNTLFQWLFGQVHYAARRNNFFHSWPTPEVFVIWHGVSPYLPEGASHQNDAEVGVDNDKDEGEHEA